MTRPTDAHLHEMLALYAGPAAPMMPGDQVRVLVEELLALRAAEAARAESDALTAVPTARELAQQVYWKCPRCRQQMARTSRPAEQAYPRPSIDHILPRVRGGTLIIHGGVRNWRLLCSTCNSFLAVCGHCPGAAAAVKAVAGPDPGKQATRASLWGMHALGQWADGEVRDMPRQQRPVHKHLPGAAPAVTLADVWPRETTHADPR